MPAVLFKRSSGATRKDGTVPREHYFVWLDQVIAANLNLLFPGMEIVEAHPFHVTRDADIIIQELEAEDLLETMEESVRQRRFGSVVRVQVTTRMPERMRDILLENLEVTSLDLYSGEDPIDLSRLMGLYGVDRYDLKDPNFVPTTPPGLREALHDGDIFSAIRQGDVLLHHPYDSFNPVLQFLQSAANDDDVLAIKQTLYRTSGDSPIVDALVAAGPPGSCSAVLTGAGHLNFTDLNNLSMAARALGAIDRGVMARVLRAATVGFFAHHLQGAPLTGFTPSPAVRVLHAPA